MTEREQTRERQSEAHTRTHLSVAHVAEKACPLTLPFVYISVPFHFDHLLLCFAFDVILLNGSLWNG